MAVRPHIGALIGLAAVGWSTIAALSGEPVDHWVKAQQLLAENILLEGIDHLARHLQTYPDDWAARMQAAEASYAASRYRAAAEHASQVYAADRTHAEARRLLVRARSQLVRLLANQEPAPEDILFFARLANVLRHIDRAAHYYERYLALNPDPDVLLEWARLYRWHDRPAAAVPRYHAYLESRPGDVDVWHELGRLYNELGRHDAAARVLGEAVSMRPGDVDIERDWARALLWRGDVDAAETVLLNLLEQHSHEVPARVILADLYNQRAEYGKAYVLYREILEHAPNHTEARWQVETFRREQRLDSARYREVLQANPHDRAARTRLIRLLQEQGEHAQALQELDLYLAHEPGNRELDALRETLRGAQREVIDRQLRPFRDARAEWLETRIQRAERWLTHQPQDAFTRRRLADWYAAAGRYWEAWQEYERILKVAPATPTLIAARDRLRRQAEAP